MTTTELIVLLKNHEHGFTGRPREISLQKMKKNGLLVDVMKEEEVLIFSSSGDGCAGAELSLVISNKKD